MKGTPAMRRNRATAPAPETEAAAAVAAAGGARDRPAGAGQAVRMRPRDDAYRRGLDGANRRDPAPEDLLLGNALHGSPVDLAEGLDVREPCFAQPACGGAGFAGADLGIQQLAQVFLVGPGFSASLGVSRDIRN